MTQAPSEQYGRDAPRLGLEVMYSIADQSFWGTKSLGIFNLSLSLLENLAEQPGVAQLIVPVSVGMAPSLTMSADTVTLAATSSPTSSRLGRIWWDQFGLYGLAQRKEPDWLFLPKGYASLLRRPPVPMAAYVHDTMHEHYRVHHPGFFARTEADYFRRSLRSTMRTASLIFTNTRFTANQLLGLAKREGISPPEIVVAGIGFDSSPHLPKAEHLVMLVSDQPHKRTGQGLSWLHQWQADSKFEGEVHLVGTLTSPVDQMWPNWRRHTRLPEAQYRELVGSAKALIYFTEFEGFGMPPVEAAITGVAPVFSLIDATSETMRDRGFGFSNDAYPSFVDALDRAISSTQEQLDTWRAELLAEHSWSSVTARIVDAMARRLDGTDRDVGNG